MGTISLQIPVSGQPNSTEDPKIASDFSIVQTVINGNIDTNNVSPTAGITGAQLSATAGITATQLAASAQFGGSVQLAFAAPSRAYRNSALSHSSTVEWELVTFDTVTFDPGAHFNTVSGYYLCPAAGYYQVNGQITFQGVSSLAEVSITKNGTVVSVGSALNVGGVSSYTVSDVIQGAVNDQLSLQMYTGAANLSVGASSLNYISVFRVA